MSKFQQRHFEALAELMQQVMPEPQTKAQSRAEYREEIIRKMCGLFAADNEHFNPDHFRLACVPGNNVRTRRRNVGPCHAV